MKKVSIILPVYNSEKTIENTISSVLAQDYDNFELIVINDGSKDNSDSICRRIACRDNRIVYYKKENSGVSNTRNFGIDKSSGDYITFIDSDDVMLPDFLSKMVGCVTDSVNLVVCGYYSILNNISKKFTYEKTIISDDMSFVIETLQSRFLFNQVWNKLYSSKIIKDYNIRFDSSIDLGEDLKFNIDYLLYVDRIMILENPLYNYIISNNGLGFKYRFNSALIKLSILEYLELFYEKKNYSKKYIYCSYIRQWMSHFSNIVNNKNGLKFMEKIKSIKSFISDSKYIDKVVKI